MEEQLYQLDFSGKELRDIPRIHAGFMTASCLAASEITIFLRLLLMATNSNRFSSNIANDAISAYAFTQALVIERSLSGKLLEYIYMIDQLQNENKKRPDATITQFLENIGDRITQIKSDQSYRLADWYRDHASHHYIVNKISNLVSYVDDQEVYTIYLHEKEGNSGYFLGEHLLLHKLSDDKDDNNVDRLTKFQDWVLECSQSIMKIHSEYSVLFINTFFDEKNIKELEVDIPNDLLGSLTNTKLPLFWNFNKAT